MPFMTFDAPVAPDDRIVGQEPPPGRELAQLLSRGIAATGFAIVDPVSPHDSYGWSFEVDAGEGQHVWCMLQLSDNWLVITQPVVPLMRKLFGRGADTEAYRRVAVAFMAVARSASEISNIRWFNTEEDFRQGREGGPA